MKTLILASLAIAAFTLSPALAAPTPTQQAYLKASNTGANDWFGGAVALSGDTMVVGAFFESSNATGVNGDQNNNSAANSGAAYVFVRNGTNWIQQAYLKASNTGANDNFGWSVAISGDTVVVGAPQESSNATGVNGNQGDNSAPIAGAAYVFVRSGTNWNQQAYLKPSNTGPDYNFGSAVAVSGDTVMIAAPGESSDARGVNGDQSNTNALYSGAAYVFVRSGTNWSQQAYLKASNTGPEDIFASAVAISGETVVVCALGEDSNATGVNGNQSDNSATDSGAAYVFVRSGTNWTQQTYLKASNTGAGDLFGVYGAVSGDTVVVAAPHEGGNATGVNGDQSNNSAADSGAVYVFVRNGTNWIQQAYLKASNTGAGDNFGEPVEISGDTVVVGAEAEDSNATGVNGDQSNNSLANSGAAYVFLRNGTNWSQQAYLKASNTGANDAFGASVAISGGTVVVGALLEDSNATGVNGNQSNNSTSASGAAYVFTGFGVAAPTQSTYEPYTFTTLAGGGGFNGPDTPGSAVRFNIINGVALDNAGNLYVVDTFNHAIRKTAPNGVTTTLAGLPGTSGSADGTGSDARFNTPAKVAVDSSGNIYVSDDGNSTIRKITPQGVVTTLAGLAGHAGSADGTNSVAHFNTPDGIVVDGAGNIYVCDAGNHTLRKLTLAGSDWIVTTIAGLAGSSGAANGTNRAARFNFPTGLDIDAAGNLYVTDDNFTLRKVAPVGTNWVVTTLAGRAGSIGSVDGTNSAARFNHPGGLAVDAATNIYVADIFNHTIRKVAPVGTNWVVTTLAGLASQLGSADGVGTDVRLNLPYDIAVDGLGNLFVADSFNYAIRKMTLIETNWVVTTFAGLGGTFGNTDGAGKTALFKGPSSVTLDSAGNAYVADTINHSIRKVTPDGEVTTLAGLPGFGGSTDGTGSAARFDGPSGVAVDNSGNLYVADTVNHTIRKMTPMGLDWAVTTIAGLADPTENGGCADGTGSAARFFYPHGVAVDGAGNVYVADTFNNTIRKVTPAGVVTTRAGSCGENGSADGIGTAARFNMPYGVAVDNATNIYVADTWNHTIRKVTPARVVTTLAGLAGSSGSADGIGNDARFNYPSGIAVDSAGNIYAADTYNNTIRKLTPIGTNWVVTTLGGMSGFYGTADGTGSTARFSNPNGVAVDSAGNLYVADFYFNTIRKGYPPARLFTSGFVGGEFTFDLTAPPARYLVVVEASTDLTSWLPIRTNILVGGALHFSDPPSGTSSNRFYRARLSASIGQ